MEANAIARVLPAYVLRQHTVRSVLTSSAAGMVPHARYRTLTSLQMDRRSSLGIRGRLMGALETHSFGRQLVLICRHQLMKFGLATAKSLAMDIHFFGITLEALQQKYS